MNIHKKAFIRADSGLLEILAKFHTYVKDGATVDARGYVIILLAARYFGRNIAGRIDCIYKRGLLRCYPKKNVTTFIIREYKG